jgi:hypothetical protein
MGREVDVDGSRELEMLSMGAGSNRGGAVVEMFLSWLLSSQMREGSLRIACFLLVAHDVLLSSVSLDFMWLCAQDAYALVAHRMSFQLPSQYLKNLNPGLFSIPSLKYLYATSLAFPYKDGAILTPFRACQSLWAFCLTLVRTSCGTTDPSMFLRYGCWSS